MNYQGSGAQFLPPMFKSSPPKAILESEVRMSEKYLADQIDLQNKSALLRKRLKETDF
jgi:hypothetical protein